MWREKIFAKVAQLADGHLDFVRKAFSDNGVPSSSRLLSVPHSIAAIFVLVYIAVKTHTWPDGTAAAGLGAFATAPYAINRASNMFVRKDKPDQTDTSDGPKV